MNTAYIAVGSNLASPIKQAKKAIDELNNIPYSFITSVSSFYRTKPLGNQDQPDYLNAAVAINTNLTPYELLNKTESIETKQGRKRKSVIRWIPRTLDLDIMLFGNQLIQTKRLTIPHYDMKNRDFMLWPLYEIAPKLYFPDGESIKDALIHLNMKKPPYW